MWEGSRVLSVRGLRGGCRSRPFSLDELEAACEDVPLRNVYVEPDSSGRLCARDGIARVVVSARPADAAPNAAALLCAYTAVEPRLQLRMTVDAAPLHELRLWFDDNTLALLDMPFLTLRNITDKNNYVCHECGAEFEQPNPLKIHMFLSCGPCDPTAFWRLCITRLRSAPTTPPIPHISAPAPDPARLEAIAAAWGRSRDGHICLYCGKLYSRKYGLKIHIRTHTGYKPLRCRHCQRAFGDPSNLNKHVRLHTAGEPGTSGVHACPLCNKPLARRRDLLRHLRAHHAR